MDSLALENGTIMFSLTRCKTVSSTKDKTVPFDLNRPELDTMLLSCGHEFHAVGMIFHWALNGNVTCPLCSKGPISRLKLEQLPAHLRASVEIKKLANIYSDTPLSAFERMTAETRAEYLKPSRLFTHHNMRRLRSAKPTEQIDTNQQAKLRWLTIGFHEDSRIPSSSKMVHDVIRLADLS